MQNLKKIMDESWIKLSEDSSVEDGFLQAADQLQDKTKKDLYKKGPFCQLDLFTQAKSRILSFLIVLE